MPLILAESLDWLTTIIGISYFGAVEGNPLLTELAKTNLIAFTILKLSTTGVIGLMFFKAEKMLLGVQDRSSRGFRYARIILKGAYVSAIGFLLIAAINNILVSAGLF